MLDSFLPELAPLGEKAANPSADPLVLAELIKQAKERAEGVYQEAFTQD